MNYTIKILMVIVATGFLFFTGCGTTRITEKTETVIKHDTLRVPLPGINDTLTAAADTVFIHGEKIVEQDTLLIVKYYPRTKKFYIYSKPDTITVTRTDTTVVTHTTTITKEPNFFEKNVWYIIIVIAGLIIIIALIKK